MPISEPVAGLGWEGRLMSLEHSTNAVFQSRLYLQTYRHGFKRALIRCGFLR
jgi:hypothetical protein